MITNEISTARHDEEDFNSVLVEIFSRPLSTPCRFWIDTGASRRDINAPAGNVFEPEYLEDLPDDADIEAVTTALIKHMRQNH